MPEVRATVAIEAQFSGSAGAWSDITADVVSQSRLIASYGISGGGPLDRVGQTGKMDFRLRNDARNSGAKLGYYSPGHADVRSGFDIGIGIRLKASYSGSTFYKWRGKLSRIEPAPGKYLSRQTFCTALDWFDIAAKRKMRLQAIQLSQRADQAIATVVSSMTDLPAASTLATGQDTFPTVFDETRDESTSVLRELYKLTVSELGYLYMQGNCDTGGVLRFEDRHYRPKYGSSSASLGNACMTGLRLERGTQLVYNRVKIDVAPRETGAAASILFQLQSKPLVAAGTCVLIEGRYTDPSNRGLLRIGGASMISPASTTDYTMNSASDGSGTDRTANFTVGASYGGNSVRYQVGNTGGTSDYVTLLQARGRPIIIKEPTVSEVFNQTSIDSYGENVLPLNMAYQDSALIANDAANSMLTNWKDPSNILESVEFQANGSDGLMKAALQREPGDKVTIAETMTALDSDFFINGVEFTIAPPNAIKCKWTLTPAVATNYWILGTLGSSELGISTVLGY